MEHATFLLCCISHFDTNFNLVFPVVFPSLVPITRFVKMMCTAYQLRTLTLTNLFPEVYILLRTYYVCMFSYDFQLDKTWFPW